MTEKKRKCLLDVVQSNLKNINYSTYITRFSYFGEYFHSSEELQELMKSSINTLRSGYGENLVSGLLLVYPKFYIHLLELVERNVKIIPECKGLMKRREERRKMKAPEDIIYMHFKKMYGSNDQKEKLGKAILLPAYHHVYYKFFTDWFHVYTSAPSLLEKIEKQTLEEIKRQISNCFLKFYHLCDYISKALHENVECLLDNLNEKVPQYLPENTILEYLLNVKSSVLMTAEDYLRIYNDVPFIQFYNDTIWPPPLDNMPRYALEKVVEKKKDRDAKKKV